MVFVSNAPASKSFAQRAIIAAALASGTSRLRAYSPCDDSEAALRVAAMLGATVVRNDDTLEITGAGGSRKKLDCVFTGESGLLTRLMIPILPQVCETPVRVDGTGTLLNRPLKGAAAAMAAFGVELRGGDTEVRVPVDILTGLIPGDAEVPGNGGSQLISGLLMALPLADEDSTLRVTDPKSVPYLHMTLDVLRCFGVKISCWQEEDTVLCFGIPGGQMYRAADFAIEGDWSGAANFLVAGTLYGGVRVRGLSMDSIQADKAIVDVLSSAGACISVDAEGFVCVSEAPLRGFDADLNDSPDIFPITALLAAFCSGESRILGVKRLASKESDRAAAIMDMLGRMGVPVRIDADRMVIEGESIRSRLLSGHLLKGGAYTSHHDHRMAFALKVASLAADSPIVTDDTECEAKSWPGFMDAFDKWASGLA